MTHSASKGRAPARYRWPALRLVATVLVATPLVLAAPAAQGDSVLAEAIAESTVDGYGHVKQHFLETDLARWLAGPQSASASTRLWTRFGDLGGEANGYFQTGSSGGSFHLYASAFTDGYEPAYAFADGVMTMHYQAAYEVRMSLYFVAAIPASGTLNAIAYSPVAADEVRAAASTALGVSLQPFGSGPAIPYIAYAGGASLSATSLGTSGIAELTGDWTGDGALVDDYTLSVSALDFEPIADRMGGLLELVPGDVLIVDYTVSVAAHASRTDFVNHIASTDFRGTTELGFLAYDPVTGSPIESDFLRAVPLPVVPEPAQWPMLGTGWLLVWAFTTRRSMRRAGRRF